MKGLSPHGRRRVKRKAASGSSLGAGLVGSGCVTTVRSVLMMMY